MKLQALSLGNDILRWFESYLVDRKSLVDVTGTFTSTFGITCGVPQGSIFGPLLFLIYVNVMPAKVKNKYLSYADDFGILVPGKSIFYVENSV